MGESVLKGRVSRVVESIKREGLQGIVIVPGPNMFYLTGVRSLLLERPFMLFISRNSESYLLSPRLEAGPYKELGIKVYEWKDEEGPVDALKKIISSLENGIWGIEGRMPFSFFNLLSSHSNFKFKDAQEILLSVREVKDDYERQLLFKASNILSKAFRAFPEIIKEGMKEKELAKKASDKIYELGSDHVEDVLVQSGPRASDPHSLPSEKKIKRKELIVVDISCTFSGYYSDITRTYSISKPENYEDVYNIVLEAQLAAEKTAKPSIPAEEVDNAARNVIESKGYGKYFIHRTGHGLGVEVHEAPFIVRGNKRKLNPGVFFTVEPGIYIQGKYGIRIEDNIYMADSFAKEITKVPKEYLWWL
jgi:Xaa-Pro aminopeptidase